MCGMFGAIGCELPPGAIERIFEVLEHRGPDGRGLFIERSAGVTLAHTRLAVIDRTTGAQPLQSEDGAIVLVANGEIYDFERIRSSLEANGHCFQTKSNSEVILYLYKQFGLACFEHLRGEFAFLLYDKTKRLLIAARDRFGIKPLYFSRVDDGLVFASEMKAIFASGLVQAKLDAAALDPLVEQDPDGAQFPFEGIEHIPPATYMTVDLDTGKTSLKRYWSPAIPPEAAKALCEPFGDRPEKAARSVLSELEEAVRLRLRADVPLGLYLSGGINSAFIGALMARNLDDQLHSFSISFVGSDRNEREFAARAADVLGTAHHELAVTKEMLWENLEDCLWFSELPFVTLAPVGKFLLSEEARQFVTVVLTGEGADEVFLGYRSFFQKAIRDTRMAQPTRQRNSVQARRLKFTGFAGGLFKRVSLLAFHKSNRSRLASARRQSVGARTHPGPVINAVQEARIAAMPLDILCFLGDREEMAHSLEARNSRSSITNSSISPNPSPSISRCATGSKRPSFEMRLPASFPTNSAATEERLHADERSRRFLRNGPKCDGETASPSIKAGVRSLADFLLSNFPRDKPSGETSDGAFSCVQTASSKCEQGDHVHDADAHASRHVRRGPAMEWARAESGSIANADRFEASRSGVSAGRTISICLNFRQG